MSESFKTNSFVWKLSHTKQGTWYGSLYFNGKRHQVHKTTKDDAKDAMRSKSERLVLQTRSGGWQLTAEEAAEWHAAQDIAREHGFSILTATQAYASNRALKDVPSVYDVAQSCLSAKGSEGKSRVYMKDLRNHFRLLWDKFGDLKMSSLDPKDFSDWLRTMKTSGRFKNNVRNSVITLWRWAHANKLCPRDADAPLVSPRFKTGDGEISVVTPENMKTLLDALETQPKLLPFVVLGGFCGARSAEILRLDWKDVRGDHIELAAHKTKTATRRIVPIPENAQIWLQKCPRSEGKIVFSNARRMVSCIAKDKGVQWHPNMLRHSFITYRVAQTQNVAQVALEAGNSPKKIFSNYRAVALPDGRLVTKELAENWFSIGLPPKENQATSTQT